MSLPCRKSINGCRCGFIGQGVVLWCSLVYEFFELISNKTSGAAALCSLRLSFEQLGLVTMRLRTVSEATAMLHL